MIITQSPTVAIHDPHLTNVSSWKQGIVLTAAFYYLPSYVLVLTRVFYTVGVVVITFSFERDQINEQFCCTWVVEPSLYMYCILASSHSYSDAHHVQAAVVRLRRDFVYDFFNVHKITVLSIVT